MFGLGYAFASKVEEGFNEAKHYITPAIGLALAGWLLHRYVKARKSAGQLVGPPVLVVGGPPEESRESAAQVLTASPEVVNEPIGSAVIIEPASTPDHSVDRPTCPEARDEFRPGSIPRVGEVEPDGVHHPDRSVGTVSLAALDVPLRVDFAGGKVRPDREQAD